MKITNLLFALFVTVLSIGSLTAEEEKSFVIDNKYKNNYDVLEYNLMIDIDPDSQKIKGQNNVVFKALSNNDTIQFDLFNELNLISVELIVDTGNIALKTKRIHKGFYVIFNSNLIANKNYSIIIKYEGKPIKAKKAPWDGGLVWKTDSEKRYFCGVACELTGASLWWPNKEDYADQPDSMSISFIVPQGYQCISNGQLITSGKDTTINNKSKSLWIWSVNYPIVNYNVTFYLGKFEIIKDYFITSNKDSLLVEFYCLDYNLEKAKKHFSQIFPMLQIYDDLFGPFPFVKDGYKLVEAPYLGMEHQTAIAYGNEYKDGYLGHHPKDITFDYIIIHETAHEYWGNNITMKTAEDLWIHEAFATYTEVLFVEKLQGKEMMEYYMQSKKRGIKNDAPIVGKNNTEGSNDMYNKGAWIIHGMRNLINNDSLFFSVIKKIQSEYAHQNISTEELIEFILNNLNDESREEVKEYLNYYLYNTEIPKIEIEKNNKFWSNKSSLKLINTPNQFTLKLKIKDKELLLSDKYIQLNKKELKIFKKEINILYYVNLVN